MGRSLKSFGDFLGTSGLDEPNQDKSALTQLNNQNALYANHGAMQGLQNYANGTGTAQDFLSGQDNPEAYNALATNPLTGSKFATEQVQSNPILGQLFGQDGLLGKEIGKEQELQNQGYKLKPEDMSMYGQASGDISRMFGQQGNKAAQGLASRGLSSAPSGAAGAMFSGLAGNQNEMLAKAQQGIMQQRFQNTMQQIQQQHSMINSLGQQGANAIQQQYGRQQQGADAQKQGLQQTANLANSANQNELKKDQYMQDNKPFNFGDMQVQNAVYSNNKFVKTGNEIGSKMMGGMMGGGGMGGGG